MYWLSPPKDLRLDQADVHVWRVALDRSEAEVERFAATLAVDERARAARLSFEVPRRRFVVARGVLRAILGRYLQLSPEEIRFDYAPRGKPSLEGPAGLHFNLSHSRELALVAVACDREIGVDVEAVRPERDLERIATRFFSEYEVTTLLAMPPEDRPAAFYRCWTRKEAYMKAVGDGLAIPLDSFDVAFDLNTPACLLANRLVPDEVKRWTMAAIDPGPGYAAAVVVEGNGWNGRYFEDLQ